MKRECLQRSKGGYKDLKVYQVSYKLAMETFKLSRVFPPDERFSLTDQIRRSSRGVVTNIAEGYRKRQYPNAFVNKLSDSDAEATETRVWLDFALDCGYLPAESYKQLVAGYEEIGRMLSSMMANPQKFSPS
ncbi:MAG: four helix bundle protein [Terriglobia bacterium]